MNVATYKTALAAWVEAQTTMTAQWRDEAGGWQSKTRARLHLSAPRSVGVDHISYDHDEALADGVDLVPTFQGPREITLSIIVTSRDQDGSGVAIFYLEKLKTSLHKESVRALLLAAGLAHASTETPVDLDSLVDDRVESMAQMDVQFNAVENERDEDEGGSFVETFKISAELTDPADDNVGWEDKDYPA